MRFVAVSFVTFLCLVNSVCSVDLHHAPSASVPSKSTHSHYRSHSYSYSYSYSYSRSRSHSHSHSHSHSAPHSASHFNTYATHAPIVAHNQINKRNIIDFFKRLINPKSNENNIAASNPSHSVSSSNSISGFPSPAASVSHNHNNVLVMLQDDPHASVGFGDLVAPHYSAATSAPIFSRHTRGGRNVSLSSLFTKPSSKASVPVSPSVLP